MAQKFYVVWSGRRTGIFTDWGKTHRAIDKYPGARYKSFPTRAEAEQAFAAGSASTASDGQKPLSRRGPHNDREFDVRIYCDGACDPNPGDAGSGIVVYRAGKLTQLWFGLYNPRGTNNTAELSALYHALLMAEAEINAGHTVEVCSDSAYSINCIRTWASGWEKRGWQRFGGEIKNLEIIQACYAVYGRIKKELTLTHVAGHAGNEGNELADRMAMLGALRKQSELQRFDETMDVRTLLKMRRG